MKPSCPVADPQAHGTLLVRMAQIIHEKRFDAVDHRAHARSMNLQSQLVPAGYGDIGALFVACLGIVRARQQTLRGDQSRQLSEVPRTCQSNGRHSRF